jgi:hypothetical protein
VRGHPGICSLQRKTTVKRFIVLAAVATLVVGCTKDEITAVYYPDRANLSHRVMDVVGSADECRGWVSQQAARHDDRNLRRGDYDCIDAKGRRVR